MKDRHGPKISTPHLGSLVNLNDRNATLSSLFKTYWEPLLNEASRYIADKDVCEEIVQSLFVHLHLRHFPMNIRISARSYLYISLRNRIFNYIRDEAVYKKHLRSVSRSLTISQNTVQQSMDMKCLEEEILSCIGKMPLRCREVYLLKEQERLSIKKISSLLHRPVDTVEKQLRRAIHFLRDHLKRQDRYDL